MLRKFSRLNREQSWPSPDKAGTTYWGEQMKGFHTQMDSLGKQPLLFYFFTKKEGWVGWPLLQNLYCSDKARTSGRMDYLNGMGLLRGNKEGIEISLVSNTKYALVSNMKNRCFGVQYEMHQIHFDGRWEAITDQSIANQFKCFCHFNFVQI